MGESWEFGLKDSFTIAYESGSASPQFLEPSAPSLVAWLEGVTGGFVRGSKLTAIGHTSVGDTASLAGNATWSRIFAVPG